MADVIDARTRFGLSDLVASDCAIVQDPFRVPVIDRAGDDLTEMADRLLRNRGGMEAITDCLPASDRSLWQLPPDRLVLDALALRSLGSRSPDQLAITATKRIASSGGLGRVGLLLVVGYRVMGNSSDEIHPLGVDEELAYAADAIVAAREQNLIRYASSFLTTGGFSLANSADVKRSPAERRLWVV